jgi:DNA polymerase elongation subunit (family B)
VSEDELAWLVGASYKPGRMSLSLIASRDLEPIRWVDSNFQPYYLSEQEQQGEAIKKLNLFTANELTLHKVSFTGRPSRNVKAWEMDIDPALSYIYDKGLRFGILHRFSGSAWVPNVTLSAEQSSRFEELFGQINQTDPFKYALLKEVYTYASQPVPRIAERKLDLPENGLEEDYYNAFLLSRIANLPVSRTYRNYSVSDWIRSMLNTYYRAHSILVPNAEELKLGDTRKFVTGALTIAPESGTYFNMHVLDFESLYPGCIDVFNLSYETIQCSHPECRRNQVPGLDLHVCMKRRGIYSTLVGALRDLRLQVFKPQTRIASDLEGNVFAASRVLKLFLVSCFGVTIRIHGLASPLLGEAITAYGRFVLQSTWDLAKEVGLKPRYGDTDSVFLDNPTDEEARKLIELVKSRFKLQLAYDRIYSVCVLSAAKKAYFGILANGEPEVKGLAIAKSNSPRFFQQTFENCLARLSEGRGSQTDFERAKLQVPEVIREAIRRLRDGRVDLTELEYRVELRDDPREKSRSKALPQPYQAAWLLMRQRKNPSRGETVGFVKVFPFRLQGRQFTVKPTLQANSREINVDDYVRSLLSSLSQTFEPMSINLNIKPASLSDFV